MSIDVRPRIAAAAVAIAAIAVFANSVVNGFAMDDTYIIQRNPLVHDLSSLLTIWTRPYWPAFGSQLGLYRPLTVSAFAVEWAAGGGQPWLFHAVNVGLHMTVCLLVFALLRRLVNVPAALFGALIFAVHPLHTEVVANVVGQAELLAAVGVLGGCLLYASRPEGLRVSMPRACAILLLFGAGLFAKESAVVLPALLVVIDLAQRRLRPALAGVAPYARAAGPLLLAMAAVVAVYIAIRVSVIGSLGGSNIAPTLPFLRGSGRVLMALRAWPEYVRLLFFPADLVADYSPAVILPVTGVTPMVALGALLLAITVLLALLTPVRPAAGLPAAWFLVTVLPTSNLILPIGVVLGERLLYTPSVAVALIAASAWAAVSAGATRPVQRFTPWLAGALLVLLGFCTVERNPDWADTASVLGSLVRDHPESYRAQLVTGMAMLQRDPANGRRYLEMANRTWPYDGSLLAQLGRLDLVDGRYGRAVERLERARELVPFMTDVHVALAYAYFATGRESDALGVLRDAEARGAAASTVATIRALALERLGHVEQAVGAWRDLVHLPYAGTTANWALLARSLARGGNEAAALAAIDSARSAGPAAGRHAPVDLGGLESAIRHGCFASRAVAGGMDANSCPDPLANLSMTLPGLEAELSRRVQ